MPPETLSAAQMRPSPVHAIRNLLISGDINEHYLFLSCLECLDPGLWAGTTLTAPAVLEGWEVELVMKFLDSPDSLIRKKASGQVEFFSRHSNYNDAIKDFKNLEPHRCEYSWVLLLSALPGHELVDACQREERVHVSFIRNARNSMWKRWRVVWSTND